jgi:Tfp pilus assembly protein PilF
MNLGVAFYKKKDLDAAIAQFRNALRLEPDYAVAHTYLGHMLKAQGKMEEANIHFNAAKKLEEK